MLAVDLFLVSDRLDSWKLHKNNAVIVAQFRLVFPHMVFFADGIAISAKDLLFSLNIN